MKTTNTTFFHDKPLFGLDIGHGSLKVMQLSLPEKSAKPRLIGYGTTKFDASSQADGVIVKPEIIAKAAFELFQHKLLGKIDAKRVALALPAYRTFTRTLEVPKLTGRE